VKTERIIQAALLVVIGALVYVMFHYLGNTVENVNTRSVFVWMRARWADKISFGADYSHGWLIPLVSVLAIWRRRRVLAAAPRRTAWSGLGLVALALLLHWIGARMQQPRISLAGLILLLWSIPFALYGWSFAKWLTFPCAYLVFCIPLNFLDSMTFPLRILSASIATSVLNGFGIAAQRSGSAIYSAAGGGFHFDVADPCSGLRSLLAMMALIAGYAWFTQKTPFRKWLLLLLSIPIAMMGNVVRVTTVAIVATAFGVDWALKVYHDYSGYLIFAAAVVMVLGVARLVNLNYRLILARWRQPA
jgi:exosortase